MDTHDCQFRITTGASGGGGHCGLVAPDWFSGSMAVRMTVIRDRRACSLLKEQCIGAVSIIAP